MYYVIDVERIIASEKDGNYVTRNVTRISHGEHWVATRRTKEHWVVTSGTKNQICHRTNWYGADLQGRHKIVRKV